MTREAYPVYRSQTDPTTGDVGRINAGRNCALRILHDNIHRARPSIVFTVSVSDGIADLKFVKISVENAGMEKEDCWRTVIWRNESISLLEAMNLPE